MAPPYKLWPGLESHPLGRQALALRKTYARPNRLSPLIAMSDPVRTPDILMWAAALPSNCAVIYRFNNFDSKLAQKLREITRAKDQQLLFRQENFSSASDGLHSKRHTDLKLIRQIKQAHPELLLTMAAIKEGEYSAPLPDIDGLLVSSVFESQSPSAGAPIGLDGLKKKVCSFEAPIFALGGINDSNAALLKDSGVAGIAVVGALA